MAIRLGIVDDKPQLIDSLVRNLEMFEEVEVVFRAFNGEEALGKVEGDMPDAVLMDIEMPVMDGIIATGKINRKWPDVKVVMLTVFDQDDKIFDAILAGAAGYLMKDEHPHKIVEGLEEAIDGGAPMSPRIAAKALRMIRSPKLPQKQLPKDFGLTKREVEILEQMAQGKGYQEVADQLFISPKTVRKHIENIYGKLQVHSKVDAVKVGLKNHWF